MRKATIFISGLMFCALLTAGLSPALVSADGSDREPSIRLYAKAPAAPIGSITGDPLGARAVAINGQVTRGDQLLWGGELLQAVSNEPVRVAIDEVGSLTLAAGSMIRVSTSRASDGERSRPLMVASLLRGDASFKLSQQAAAYVEAAGSAFTAKAGARFQVLIRDNRAMLDSVAGEVTEARFVRQQDLKIRALDELGRPIASGSRFSVRARSTRQVQIQVTDKDDKPIPDLAILFSLGDPCLGSLGLGVAAGTTFREKTDNRGIAAVPFTAGAVKCLASLTASVEGTNTSLSLQVQVNKSGLFTLRNSLIGAGVMAGAGVGVYYATKKDDPIEPLPPPVIRP
ncbi:MAG TPA: hypothetical protein VKA70_11990 [Blastocatellia bacterium]|nr:hypothetical protein [Blastocatellia bacterium]